MKVFLDLDGVLVDFRRGICEAFNRNDPSTNWTFWENWEGITSGMVNAKCNNYFWKYLNWTHDGQEIEQAVRNKFKDIYLLTTPMPNPGSGTGKLEWIKQYMPWIYDRVIFSSVGVSKSLFAKPDTLLIDDKDKNIAEFIAAGGHGILVPRPWNELHGWANETLQVVKNSLEEF